MTTRAPARRGLSQQRGGREHRLDLEVLRVEHAAGEVVGEVRLVVVQPVGRDRLGGHAGVALPVRERPQRPQVGIGEGDDQSALLVQLEAVRAVLDREVEPQLPGRQGQAELGAGPLVGHEYVALAAARRTAPGGVAVEHGDGEAGPGGVVGAGGADDAAADDHQVRHLRDPADREVA